MQNLQNFLIAKYVAAKMKAESFLKSEKGEANIIAVILVLAIVIALVVVFRSNIETMVNKIWGAISGNLDSAVATGGIGNTIPAET